MLRAAIGLDNLKANEKDRHEETPVLGIATTPLQLYKYCSRPQVEAADGKNSK